MRSGFLTSLPALLTTAGLAFAQPAVARTPPAAVETWPGRVARPEAVLLPVGSTTTSAAPGAGTPVGSSSCCPDSCGPEAGCLTTLVCAPRCRVWASGEYLLWWMKDTNLPPLVTASPEASGAILGQPGTQILFGGEQVDNEARSGGRFALGLWLDECQHLGLEAGYLFLGSRSVDFTAGTSGAAGTPVLGVPFFDVLAGRENAQVFAAPNMMAGTIHVDLASRLQGYELNGIYNVGGGCCDRLDLLAGFRYLQLDEGLNINENFTVAPGVPVFGGNQFSVADQIATHTRFYGAQIGARAEFRNRNWTVDVITKIALGSSHQVVDIGGNTVIVAPGAAPSAGQGGVLALPTNSGRGSRDEFAVLPEVGIHVGYQVTEKVRALVGYSFVYLSDAVRPGEQLDRSLNISQIPSMTGGTAFSGPRRPAFNIDSTDFWAQGVSIGLEFRY